MLVTSSSVNPLKLFWPNSHQKRNLDQRIINYAQGMVLGGKLLENSTPFLAKTPKNKFYVFLTYEYYELGLSWRLDVRVLNFVDKTQENLSKDIIRPEYYFHSKSFFVKV